MRQAEVIARAKLERERLGLRSAQRRQRAARVLLAARRELGIDKQVVSSRFMEGVEQKAAEGREDEINVCIGEMCGVWWCSMCASVRCVVCGDAQCVHR